MGHMKSYLGSIKSVKLVWPKVKRPRQVRKERFFTSSQRALYKSIKMEKNPEGLGRHVLDMAAQHARFIFVREGLVGKSILSRLCSGRKGESKQHSINEKNKLRREGP